MDRDFDEEKIIDKMIALRENRDMEILNEQLSRKIEEQENTLNEKVLDIKYLGKIDEEDIFLIIEQKQDKDGNLIQIERYVNEQGEVIAGNNKADGYDFIMLSEKYQDKDELLEKLQELSEDELLDLNEIEEERLEKIAKTLGISKEEIEKMAEIDPEQELEQEEVEKEEKNTDNKKVLTQKQLKNVSAKTSIGINQKVTDGETVGSLLNVQDKGYKRIDAVYSDKLQGDGNSTKFSFVGIKEVVNEKGEKEEIAEKIDTIDQRYGTTPSKTINALNRDGSTLEEKQVNSIYQIKGDNENQVAIRIGAMGTIEVDYVRTPRQDNNEAISIPIETRSIKPTTRETREFMNKARNPELMKETDKIKQHKEVGCEEIGIKDINDNIYDDTHTHIEMDEKYLYKLAEKILENDEIAEVYNKEDVKAVLVKTIGNKEVLDTEKLREDVEKQMEEDAKLEYRMPERNNR